MDEVKARAPGALRSARAVVLLGDEGDAHLLANAGLHRNVAGLVERGGGLVLLHGSAVAEGALERDLVAWVGGVAHSERGIPAVNWPAGFATLPAHPALTGLTPFSVNDRWLPARRLQEGKSDGKGVTRLLETDAPEYAQLEGAPGRQTRPGPSSARAVGAAPCTGAATSSSPTAPRS